MTRIRASLPARQRRLLASGSVALDVTHTGGVGQWVEADLVLDAQALALWLEVLLERDVAQGLDIEDFRALREALFQCARRHVGGKLFRAEDVETLNRLARGPAMPLAMTIEGTADLPIVSVDQALAHIAREGITLFTGPQRGRIRECSAPDCQLLFVDASRPGRRQWCSMARCGNIAKTRAYRGKAYTHVDPAS
jgi:predicted RNA-binding Zn ribbon-like protein